MPTRHLNQQTIKERFPPMDLKSEFTKEEEVKQLSDLIRNLDLANENQLMSLQNIPIDYVYPKQIVSVSNFNLDRYSKLIYDFRSTSILYYDIE